MRFELTAIGFAIRPLNHSGTCTCVHTYSLLEIFLCLLLKRRREPDRSSLLQLLSCRVSNVYCLISCSDGYFFHYLGYLSGVNCYSHNSSLRLVYVFLIVHRYNQHSLRLLLVCHPRHALSLPTFVLSPN